LAQNNCAARIFLNAFGLTLENVTDIDAFSKIKIFNKDMNVVGKLHFDNGKVMISANYNNSLLEASYDIAKVFSFIDRECGNALFGQWSSKIEFKVENNNNIKLNGEFLIGCSVDSEFGIKCLCHPLINCEVSNKGKITLKILRDGRTFGVYISSGNYEETIRIGAKGAVDIALGIYSDTSLYEEWKIIYPAVIDNPVHLVMVPSRISEVKSIDDLKNLKGAIDSRDHFNDFVTDQLQNFNLEKLDNSEEIYRKLISGEIDYVFVTYWYGMAEVLKLGVQEMVSFSKKSIWNMPLFLGVSKMSQNRRFFSHQLTEWMKDDAKREKFKQRIIEALQQLAEENRGKVPLTYQPNKSDM